MKAVLFIALYLVWCLEVFSQQLLDQKTPQPLFMSDTPIEITIIFDMDRVLSDTAARPEYQSAKLIEYKSNGAKIEYKVKLKTCGNTRRLENICEFPPLKINFQRSALLQTTFEGQDKLKLITHCREADDFEDYAILEYLSYKLFNRLTENSYRVRLVNVRYQDSQGKNAGMVKTGFFLEDDETLAKRMNGSISDKKIWSADSCDGKAVSLLTLFEFMIGNTDWWIHTRHNVEIIELADGRLVPVPYDFDYAGMVNTPYAVPSAILPIESVRQRFLKGFCHETSYYQDAINQMLSQQHEILATIENTTALDKKFQRSALRYLEDFFGIVQDNALLEKYIGISCDYYAHPEKHLKYAKK